MSGFNLALPPQHPTAHAAINGTMSMNNKGQGHPDRYPCIECPEHFANAVSRAAHMHTAHKIEEGFLCHECVSSCCDQPQHTRHVNDHFHARCSPPQMTCTSLKCNYKSSSQDALDGHRRDDHCSDGSHQAHCPKCVYHNDSIVGVWVHMLHVHSKDGVAKRKEALQLKKESQATAMRAARAAKAARIAERRAAANAASSNATSSPAETTQASESTHAPSKKWSRAKQIVSEEEQEIDARAANSNAFLDSQMA